MKGRKIRTGKKPGQQFVNSFSPDSFAFFFVGDLCGQRAASAVRQSRRKCITSTCSAGLLESSAHLDLDPQQDLFGGYWNGLEIGVQIFKVRKTSLCRVIRTRHDTE
jgi:hypothetical protein